MSRCKRSDFEKYTLLGFVIVFLIWLAISIGVVAYGSGREDQRRDQAPAAYSDTAKKKAMESCAGQETGAAYECIYEKVESSQEQARGEQDLIAQQKSANGTLITAAAALISLFVSMVGIGLVYTTFAETRKANEIANNVGYNQLRPFMVASGFENINAQDGSAKFLRIIINWTNAGNTPALHASFDVLGHSTKNEIWGDVEPNYPDPDKGAVVVGPHLMKTSAPVYFPLQDIIDCYHGKLHLYVFAKVTYRDGMKKDSISESRILWKFFFFIPSHISSFSKLEDIAEIRYVEIAHYSGMT